VVSISEDPLLAEQEASESERTMMGPEGEPIDGREDERKLWEVGNLLYLFSKLLGF
jgi:hypothetical protein